MKADYIAIAIYIGIAFVAAAVLVFSAGLALHLGSRVKREPAVFIFLAIVVAIMAAPLATGRVLSGGLSFRDASMDEITQSFWVTRLLTLAVLAVCAERILRFIVKREWNAHFFGWGLFWAFFAYVFTNQVLNAAFGAHPGFDHRTIYALLAYFAIFLVAQNQADYCLRWVRNALAVFLLVSAATVLVRPGTVLDYGYAGFLPGIGFRYYGLATHANTIGPLAVTFMICLWHMPYRSKFLNMLFWGLALGSLLLTQSKTSIAIAALIGVFLAVYRYRMRVAATANARASLTLGVTAAILIGAGVLGVGGLFAIDLVDAAMRKAHLLGDAEVYSLTGRTRIWQVAWQEFLNNPLFGYGPSIWEPLYRFRVGLLTANHAHNQLLQSLSEAGVVGGIGLLTYVVALVVYAVKASARTEGVSLAIVLFILVRSVTEVPLSTSGVVQSEMVIQLIALLVCVGLSPAQRTTMVEARTTRRMIGSAHPSIRHGAARMPTAAR